jgi:hypothetical protein
VVPSGTESWPRPAGTVSWPSGEPLGAGWPGNASCMPSGRRWSSAHLCISSRLVTSTPAIAGHVSGSYDITHSHASYAHTTYPKVMHYGAYMQNMSLRTVRPRFFLHLVCLLCQLTRLGHPLETTLLQLPRPWVCFLLHLHQLVNNLAPWCTCTRLQCAMTHKWYVPDTFLIRATCLIPVS